MYRSSILICATIVFGVRSANIPIDHVKLKIFDIQNTSFELRLSHSLKSTKIFFANTNVANIIAQPEISSHNSVIPFVGQLTSLTSELQNLLAKDSNWMESFARTTANESRHDIALTDIHWMQAAMEYIQNENTHLSGIDYFTARKRIASFIHSDFHRMITLFSHQYSIFNKYPLVGAPVLIEMALLIAVFTPIANKLIPLEVKHPQIACKTLDTLLEFRQRTVNARLEKLQSNNTLFIDTLAAVRQMPYNSSGYNSNALECRKNSENQSFLLVNGFRDDFSATDEYYSQFNKDPTCFNGYISYVRHQVEKMFPVQLLEKVCIKRKSNVPTGKSFSNEFSLSSRTFFKRLNNCANHFAGYGWLTIKIKNVRAHGLADGSDCDVSFTSLCDPYLKLFINGEKVIQTDAIQNIGYFDANTMYQSIKIPKSSTIKIEVWDDDSGFFGTADDLILRTEGTIDSFMKSSIRYGAVFSTRRNSIETISFWQDEFE